MRWSTKQLGLLNNTSRVLWIEGTTGTGKTAVLQEVYRRLVADGVYTGRILVLAANRTQVNNWRWELQLPHCGPRLFVTYFGWVQQELVRYWSWVAPRNTTDLEPCLITADLAHHLMQLEVERGLAAGQWREVKTAADGIASQLLDNLNTAALAGLPWEAFGQRWAAADPKGSGSTWRDGVAALQGYRQQLEQAGIFDYARALELYNQKLLPLPQYRQALQERVQILLVDNLEETAAVTQDLILCLLEGVQRAWLAINNDGGHGSFRGADPTGARRRLLNCSQPVYLPTSFTSSPEVQQWGDCLAGAKPFTTNSPVEFIQTELHHEMARAVVRRLLQMRQQGIDPNQIAMIVPTRDTALALAIDKMLQPAGWAVRMAKGSRRLNDLPLVRAMSTLARLAHPLWQLPPAPVAVARLLARMFNTDPVRAAFLANNYSWDCSGGLPALAPEHRRRLGFAAAERFDHLINWLNQYRSGEPWLPDVFYQRCFGELLAIQARDSVELAACRRVLAAAVQYVRVINRVRPCPSVLEAGRNFTKMVIHRVLAVEDWQPPALPADTVVMTTPYNFLTSLRPVEYQFWIDLNRQEWSSNGVKELLNPYILARDWPADQRWTLELDNRVRREAMVRTARALAYRCQRGIVLAASSFSAMGYEQNGSMVELAQAVHQLKEVGDCSSGLIKRK